jgi:hypothetical protein
VATERITGANRESRFLVSPNDVAHNPAVMRSLHDTALAPSGLMRLLGRPLASFACEGNLASGQGKGPDHPPERRENGTLRLPAPDHHRNLPFPLVAVSPDENRARRRSGC